MKTLEFIFNFRPFPITRLIPRDLFIAIYDPDGVLVKIYN